MKQITLWIIGSMIVLNTTAQNVGIGTTTPDVSSKLEINSNNSGLLIPRMTAAQRIAISNPANGLLVYDLDSVAFAYRTGGAWLFLMGTNSKANDWGTTGNAGTNVNNFMGTIDVQPLRFRMNNVKSGIIDSTLSNTSLGFRTLDSVTTGNLNSAFGFRALNSLSDGVGNTAIGANTLRFNVGSYNTAIGVNALYANTTGINNTATGLSALQHNTTGNNNAATGLYALYNNTTGSNNTANGTYALMYSTLGDYNTANGYQALLNNTTGSSNTANGSLAMASNTIGGGNAANGYQALYYNTTGSDNTANGYQALAKNTTGSGNTANGYRSLYNNSTGNNNIAIGFSSLDGITASDNNVAIGFKAASTADYGYNNVFIGPQASGQFAGQYNMIALGYLAICTASNQVTIGNSSNDSYRVYANWSNISDGRYKRNIRENVPGLAFINKLRPVTYNLNATALDKTLHSNSKDSSTVGMDTKFHNKALQEKEQITYTGFVAQDVEAAAKSLGFDFSGVDKPKNNNDTYGLRYAEFVVPLVKAVQEQQQIIEKQQQQIDVLTKEMQLLKEKIR